MNKYGGREPTTQELQADVDKLLGALDAPINAGVPGQSMGSGARSPYGGPASGMRSPYDSGGNFGGPRMPASGARSPVTGGYASGARTPVPGNYSTPGERFSGATGGPRAAEPVRFQHMDAVLESLDGRTVPMPGGDHQFGHGPASSQGDLESSGGGPNGRFFREFEPHAFPEQGGLVMPLGADDEDDDHGLGKHGHGEGDAAIKRLHDEMDALIADTSSPQLTAEQQMLLRQNEISNRAQMEAFRVPVTASIDRVMQRNAAPQQGMPPNMIPPEVQRKQDDYDSGLFGGFRCFRACS